MLGDAVEVVIEMVDALRHQIDLAVVLPEGVELAEEGAADDEADGTEAIVAVPVLSEA
jgi:ribonuclease R